MIDPQTYDWSQFEIVFYYNKPVHQVFQYWATGAGLEAFFIEDARFVTTGGARRGASEVVQTGDQYQWRWRQPFTVEGEITNVKLNEEISFTFGAMQVSVHFTQVDEQTEVHLVQTDIPNTADGQVFGHLNCRSCWVFFLTNLSSILETGQDLRDASPDRVSAMEVGFFPLSQQQNVAA